MKKTLVCAIGDQPEALYPALKEFNFEHAHILTHKHYAKQAKQFKKDLKTFSIPYSEKTLSDDMWEDTFVKIAEFAKQHPRPEHIIVHTGTGDRAMQCAATSASFVNGLKAINGNAKMVFGLPIMRFNYYSAINARKRTILEHLQGQMKSMQQLSEEAKISLSLLSYHVHGNRKSEGLIDMGLVELMEKDNQQHLSLTAMARLLLKGAVPHHS